MLAVLNTECKTNVRISGDYWDLKELQQAMRQLLDISLIGSRTNYMQKNYIIRFCKELEQAMEGDEVIETTYNGICDEIQEDFIVPFSQENIYFSFEKTWPKMLFTILCLNYFIEELTIETEKPYAHTHIMTIRKFQSLVFECFSSNLHVINPSQTATLFFTVPHNFQHFLVQYVDLINAKYFELSKEEKMNYLSTILYKFNEPDFEYSCFKRTLQMTAKEINLPIHRIILQTD